MMMENAVRMRASQSCPTRYMQGLNYQSRGVWHMIGMPSITSHSEELLIRQDIAVRPVQVLPKYPSV